MSYQEFVTAERRQRRLVIIGVILQSVLLLTAGGVLLLRRLAANESAPDQAAAPTAVPIRTPAALGLIAPTTSLVLRPVESAPDFTLPDLYDETREYTLSEYAGQPVILNFWASWCAPCREEMPALERVYAEHREAGFTVLGINQTMVDDLAAARAFVDELGLTFPNARDDAGDVSDDLYRVMGLPTSIFVTPAGDVARLQIGVMTNAQVEEFSHRLMNDEPLSP